MDMETLQPGTNSTRASSGIVPDPGMSFEMTVYYDDDDDNKMDDTDPSFKAAVGVSDIKG